ncbi:hypothetical protein [Candidatus Hakubella thermalkaliphila]|uniref:Uncharacterized protein n=1 Tax=Candidatus Hakubella thermalkaliphila TaxID=2754717 RepID=A0A6V8PFG0_9ACTN|nr:hypothetical protein [Candidatus Hakubella thermalkaliphila]GFP31073.1 hypothetical protein HKBW3S34_01992 [Candidatus Hakubella thermalkaliphila]
MVKQEYINQLVGVQGHRVLALHFGENRKTGDKELVIELGRHESKYRCPCGRSWTPTTIALPAW